MTVSRNLNEAQRWLKQALHDRDAARLNRDHAFHEAAALEPAFAALDDACRRLDQLYIPTRYPNGLPDNVPHDFYDRALADQAIADVDTVIERVQRFVSINPISP